MNNFFNKFKESFKNKEISNKKKIENLIVFLIIIVITILGINIIWKEDKTKTDNTDVYKTLAVEEKNVLKEDIEVDLKTDLEKILTNINGVGKTEVLITYKESSKIIAMYNENVKQSITEEADSNGGNRKIEETDNQKEIIYTEENGEKKPITEKIIMPQIEGAIVIAEGAENSEVKSNIIQAVEAVTGLPTYKIQVFKMKGVI